MAYSELVKNFEKVRAYMREFYVYGFKSRSEYDSKSARSYDDERRRLESWLGDYMRFTQTAEGKNVFFSVDSRATSKNPFYKAWKAKSFTDKEITLHFAIFDVLHSAGIKKTLTELIEDIDELLQSKMSFDESTLSKKLKEYVDEGIIQIEKEGRKILYSRSADIDISNLNDVVEFFSEAAPCGVIGSFIQDRQTEQNGIFSFKHHYMTQAIDSEIMAKLFDAMRQRCYITADNLGKHSDEIRTVRLVPLKILISAQNGRQNLIAFHEKANRLNSYRLDYMSNIRIEEPCEKFDTLRALLLKLENYMWGVNCKWDARRTERVVFEIRIDDDEQFIVQRLEREKRCGHVDKIDDNHYRYTAYVFDTNEMLPWIRTFISRITKLKFSDRTVENTFKTDLQEMYRIYDIDGSNGNDFQ